MGQYKRKLKNKGIRYFYSGQYLSVKYHSKCIYKTKQEARKAEREKRDEIDRQARNPHQDIKLFDLMQSRLDDIQSKKSLQYYRRNRDYFKVLNTYMGDIDVLEITRARIVEFLRHLVSMRTNHSVNYAIRCYKALFNFGIKVYDLDIKNPCYGLDFYSVDKKLKKIPTDREIGAVKEQFDDEECSLFHFVIETGARINEALALTAKDIYDEYVVLYTRKSRYSNRVPRKVPIVLKTEKKERVFDRWVAQPRFLEKAVKIARQEMWGWHNLRHRYASKLSKENRPIFEIMQLLGHSQISTTQNYLQLLP